MKLRLILCVLTSLLIIGFSVSSSNANPLWAGYFELQDAPYDTLVPPNGSVWIAVSATLEPGGADLFVNQAEYDDRDENGLVSTNDEILGPPVAERKHIGVASAFRLYRVEGSDRVLRPQIENPGGPVGETWEVIYPDAEWGITVTVDDWTDAAPAGPSVGDAVHYDGSWHAITQISLCVEGSYATPVERTTWSRIKALFVGGM